MSDTRTPCPLKDTEDHVYLHCTHCINDTLWRHQPNALAAKEGGYYDQFLDAMDARDGRPMPLPVGTRVRHRGEQYWQATASGTGTVAGIVCYYPQDRTYEYLVLCDEPPMFFSERMVERNHIVQVHVGSPEQYATKLEEELLADPEFYAAFTKYWTKPTLDEQ